MGALLTIVLLAAAPAAGSAAAPALRVPLSSYFGWNQPLAPPDLPRFTEQIQVEALLPLELKESMAFHTRDIDMRRPVYSGAASASPIYAENRPRTSPGANLLPLVEWLYRKIKE
jgi:hypothetical protein